MKNVILAGIASTMGLAIGLSALAQDTTPSAERGLETFMRVGCYQCHGTQGQGSGSGTALIPDPLPAEAIANFIRHSPGRMPPYPETVLSDAEIADIAAYLETVPAPPTPDGLPALKDLSPSG